ncbi:MAG TPA: BON domain-containing protein [Nitrospira sp.]|jgi:BON domain-containing protein|nr:BON domain-containing protein [Nitrospira sp.]HEV2172105.1 BON domain-containing protein [Nitrospira sp.]
MQLVHDGYIAREIGHDEIIAETLLEWFNRRPSLRDVSVSVTGGVALLRGYIVSNRDRALAVELALDAGADEVQDELMLTWPLAA